MTEIGPRRGLRPATGRVGYALAASAAFVLAVSTVLSVRYLQPSVPMALVTEAPEAIAEADQKAAPPPPPADTPRASPEIAVQALAPVEDAPIAEVAVARLQPRPEPKVALRPLGPQADAPAAPLPAPVRTAAPPPRAADRSAPPPPAPPSPSSQARVQIAALSSEADARAAWGRVQQRFPGQTARRSLEIQPVETGGQTLYRAVVRGFANDAEAQSFCEALQASGQDCLPRGLRRPGA